MSAFVNLCSWTQKLIQTNFKNNRLLQQINFQW